MRRARSDDSFTWQPFDHGRQRRVAALVAVGLCSRIVGLAVGRVSSGGSVDSPRSPTLEFAVRKNDQIGAMTSVPTQTVTQKNNPSLSTSPPVVLLNPNSEKLAASVEESKVSDEERPHRRVSPTTAVEEKRDQNVPPAKGTLEIGPTREQTRTHRAPVLNETDRSNKPRGFRPERPPTLADYGALRDYMMRH